MAYDAELAHRVRQVVRGEPGLSERRMFGGLAFLVDGSMAVCAVSGGGLMVRTDPADTDALVAQPHVRRFEIRGRELDGWLHVYAEGLVTDGDVDRWVRHGVSYARSLSSR